MMPCHSDEEDPDDSDRIVKRSRFGCNEVKEQFSSILFGSRSDDDDEENNSSDKEKEMEQDNSVFAGEVNNQFASILFGSRSNDDDEEKSSSDEEKDFEQDDSVLAREVKNQFASILFGSQSNDNGEENRHDDEEDSSLLAMDVNNQFASILFGSQSDDDKEENTIDNGYDDLELSGIECHSDEEKTNDESLGVYDLSDDVSEEGSIASGDVHNVDDVLEVDDMSPRRSRSHIEIEKSQQYNLFLLLPQLHRERIRLESMWLTVRENRECDRCQVLNPPRLWRCNECSILKHAAPRLCEECIVSTHINNPHCMDILCAEETVFRKPFFDETITFRLAIIACQSCNSSVCLKPPTFSVLIASLNGIFHCTCPEGGSKCNNCGAEVICSPVAFDCLPCEPVHQSGCTWFTNSLLSFIRTLRSEGGSSANALARAIMEHWISRKSFLVSSDGSRSISTNAGTFPVPNITVHWLEKKLAQILTTGILLEHPSWSDGRECFTLDDRLSSICAACHDNCAQIHIDGFFKMRRM